MPHKADTTVICQCGAMVCKYYMAKHLRTAKHERDMVGREGVEVVEHLHTNHVIINIDNVFLIFL